jgi:dipeptidyl-peptidase-4
MMFAKFSPDGTRVAYVRKTTSMCRASRTSKSPPLTKDGSDTIINGTSDWVNEEELGCAMAFRWSPDGKRILFWQFDTTDVKRFHARESDGGQLSSASPPFPTRRLAKTIPQSRLGVVPAMGGAVTWLKAPGDARQHYLPSAEWTPDGSRLLVQQFNRLQNTLKVLLAEPATGETKPLLVESDQAWVENKNSELRWLGHDFLWLSERSGWRHAYRVSLDGVVKADYERAILI